jgi:hypothetical protein
MALVLTTEEFLAAYAPLAKALADGTITEAEFEVQAAPVFDAYLLGDARVARIVKIIAATDAFENRISALVADWYSGTATGGPNGDGLYPLPNSDGVDYLVPSPALLASTMAKGDPGRDARVNLTFSCQFGFGGGEEFGDYQAVGAQAFDLAASKAFARSPGATEAVFIIKRTADGSTWGTVTFAPGSNVGVLASATPALADGEAIYWKAPDVPVAGLANVSFTLAGAA